MGSRGTPARKGANTADRRGGLLEKVAEQRVRTEQLMLSKRITDEATEGALHDVYVLPIVADKNARIQELEAERATLDNTLAEREARLKEVSDFLHAYLPPCLFSFSVRNRGDIHHCMALWAARAGIAGQGGGSCAPRAEGKTAQCGG
jgi:hypothetical protein